MKRVTVLLLLGVLACANPSQDEEEETAPPPIGPGSDSTTLIPPDTPESRFDPPATRGRSPNDTLR